LKNKKMIIILVMVLMIGAISIITRNDLGSKKGENNNVVLTEEESKATISKLKGNRTAYEMKLKLDTNNKNIEASEKVSLRNNNKVNLNELVFHLYADSYNLAETRPSIGGTPQKLTKEEIGDIKINSVKFNNEDIKFTEDNQVLKIPLKSEFKPGEEMELEIAFTLKIPKSNDRLGYYNEQYSITNWYPILSVFDESTLKWDENPFHPVGESNYSECSDYKLEIAVPKGMVVATTGIKTVETGEDLEDKLVFEAENSRDFMFFMSKDYKVVSKEVDGVKVNSYYLKEESTAKRMLNLAGEALRFYNTTFGKYPYSEYDVVESYLQGGAMEYPSITQMGAYPKLSEDYKESNITFFDEAVVHETGHQWWYSTVGNNEFKEPVLDESFTSYSTALFFENLYGEYSANGVKGAFLRSPFKISSPIFRSTDKYTWQDFSLVVYNLGPVVLEDLRQKVGKEKFLEIFKCYYERYKFKNATFDGFISVIEEKCGNNISEYVRNSFRSENYSSEGMRLSKEEMKKIK
jgi:aminopeptidase N